MPFYWEISHHLAATSSPYISFDVMPVRISIRQQYSLLQTDTAFIYNRDTDEFRVNILVLEHASCPTDQSSKCVVHPFGLCYSSAVGVSCVNRCVTSAPHLPLTCMCTFKNMYKQTHKAQTLTYCVRARHIHICAARHHPCGISTTCRCTVHIFTHLYTHTVHTPLINHCQQSVPLQS